MTLYLYQAFPAPVGWLRKFTKYVADDVEDYIPIIKTILLYLKKEVEPFLDLNPRQRYFDKTVQYFTKLLQEEGETEWLEQNNMKNKF